MADVQGCCEKDALLTLSKAPYVAEPIQTGTKHGIKVPSVSCG